MTKQMDMVLFIMQMETFMRANGLTTKPMAREFTIMQMELITTESGKRTNSMVSALRDGRMAQFTKGITTKARKTEEES